MQGRENPACSSAGVMRFTSTAAAQRGMFRRVTGRMISASNQRTVPAAATSLFEAATQLDGFRQVLVLIGERKPLAAHLWIAGVFRRHHGCY